MKRYSFNQNWTFHKAGLDSRRVLTLPHDAMLEERREPDSTTGSGGAYFTSGTYIYEKNFTIPEEWKGKTVLLQFEGVYRNAEVHLNGQKIGGCKYGYAPFWVELPERLLHTGENQLKVTADNHETPNSRWYSGAGIYRPVWLWLGEKAHILPEGVRITTVSYAPAEISVEVETSGDGEISVEILDGSRVAASGSGAKNTFTIPNAKLWSAETPYLYQCRVSLRGGVAVDEMTLDFGIRKIEWGVKGLFINGQETLLRGGCMHHDSGILGSACYPESEFRRVKKLKEWGFNAIRSAHNPANPALLDACDRLGIYVMDEMWDMWYWSKTTFDYSADFMENYASDIESTVRRDYNHPSVILYSIGNEVTEPAEERGVELGKKLVDILHRLDAARPVTCGLNLMLVMMAKKGGSLNDISEGHAQAVSSTEFNERISEFGKHMTDASNRPEAESISAPLLELLDIAGYNYATGRYPLEGEAHPDRVLVGSETYPQDIAENWRMVEKYPYVIGDFMWTAWDYLGEVGLGSWCYQEGLAAFAKAYPWLLAEAGVIDILGDDTAEAGLAAAVFEKREAPYIGVRPVNHPGITPAIAIWRGTNAIPSWSWRNCEGNRADVEIYADAEEAELLLNGASVSRKPVENFTAKFELPYAPGKLEAVTYKEGREVGRGALSSADGALHIDIQPEETLTRGKLAFVRVNICGENGVVESAADETLTVRVEGGTMLGFGSARPSTEESYLTGTFTTHYGRSMAVIRPESDTLTVHVKSSGGKSASGTFSVLER